MKRSIVLAALLTVAVLQAAGCSRSDRAGGAAGGGDVALDGKALTVAGVTVTPPGVWKDLGPTGIRAASYVFGPTAGDRDSATVAVFYFGKAQGGAVQQNIDRWIAQMSLPNGSDPAKAAKRSDTTVDGMPAHLLQLTGTYSGGMGATMGEMPAPRENYLMSAVVLEAPEGNVFFKLTGPMKTAEQMNHAFLAMVKAAKKGS